MVSFYLQIFGIHQAIEREFSVLFRRKSDIDKMSSALVSRKNIPAHLFLIAFALFLAYVLAGLFFSFNVSADVFFGLSIVLLLFALVQGLTEVGSRRLLIFILITAVLGYIAEVLGTSTGVPFGKYQYTNFLGEKVLGVPVVVPLVWFVISYMTFSLTFPNYRLYRSNLRKGLLLCALAAFGSVAWDLFIDPMFTSYGYWTWDTQGSAIPTISGIPVSNFIGWFVLVFLMLAVVVIVTTYSFAHDRAGRDLMIKGSNTWDSRIVYSMLILDGMVANFYLANYVSMIAGFLATTAFLVVAYIINRK